MPNTKIPAPEPCAQITGGHLQWYFPPADAYYPVDAKYLRGLHMLITLESAETWAAAREAAARMEGVRSVQEQTGVIVRAALELLESVEGNEPFTAESMRAFKRVFGAG